MSVVELRADDGAGEPLDGERGPVPGSTDRERPDVAGDLPALFRAAPMFRRALAGYDRFQVDSYVRWAEEELATADREREHLLIRHLSTQAALDEARTLLSHSSSGGEFLQVSRRIGNLLASAADEAESLRVDAETDRAAGAAEAARMVAEAAQQLADAQAEAERVLHAGAADAEARNAEAHRVLDEARAEAQARLDDVRRAEQLAAEQADRIRQQAGQDATAALSAARAEVVRMLSTGREERRRADAAATAARERLERNAELRLASLTAEIAVLEQRRSALAAPADPAPVARPARRPFEAQRRDLRGKLHWGSRSLRLP
jgi:hypothetical protein